ncbi:restriction endonuclease subunit S [Methanococcoides sp. FTZ1]|uniref:restriction endonuclease subunit S n=1 Tax=Methanococcoides sp. FTZ1 TaxID=3439061 RepID=UPI003F842034
MIHDLKPYPSYKDSGVPWLGEVPEHWEVKRLKQCSERFYTGGTPDSGNAKYYCNPPEGLPWLMIADMTSQKYVKKTVKAITEEGRASKNLEILPKETILYSIYASLGTVSILEIEATVNQAIIGIKFRQSELENKFAYYYLENLRPHLALISNSSTQANLNAEKVRSLPVFLPPLTEQSAIVCYLDYMNRRIHRYIYTKQKLIKLLEEQKQAIIHRAVTRGLNPNVKLKDSGVEWLEDVPEHWEVILNQRIFKEKIRPHDGQAETPLSLSQRDGLIPTSEMQERSLQTSTYDNWKVTIPGDLVLNRFKAHLGVFFSSTIRGIVSFHYGVFEPRRPLTTKYFELLYHTNVYRSIYAGRSNGMTVGLQNLSNQNYYNVHSIVPPIEEQKEIVHFAEMITEQVTNTINDTHQEIKLLKEYRTRLISDVVTGKLDVREAAANLPVETEDMEIFEDETEEIEENTDDDFGEMTEED